jgi:hypothetical protein
LHHDGPSCHPLSFSHGHDDGLLSWIGSDSFLLLITGFLRQGFRRVLCNSPRITEILQCEWVESGLPFLELPVTFSVTFELRVGCCRQIPLQLSHVLVKEPLEFLRPFILTEPQVSSTPSFEFTVSLQQNGVQFFWLLLLCRRRRNVTGRRLRRRRPALSLGSCASRRHTFQCKARIVNHRLSLRFTS